jgi:excisionase family DNA binding protein
MEIKEVYSVNEVMNLLGVCRMTVVRYIKDKKLKAFRVGSQWRIFGDSLEAFIKRNSN